jgi:D-alanyl-D-alanine carboxypeptidase/D-alanyl-D-alanine-endopeptidase (penicillin-binding protein 4)
MKRSGAVLGLCACVLNGASLLEQRIDDLVRRTPALAPGVIGIEAVQINTGKVLYSRDPDRLFIPASNTKLFSTALALLRLGPDHRFTTRVYSVAPPDSNGRIAGDLILYGGGDPSMSNVPVPYLKDALPTNPLEAIDQFADQIAARGVRSLEGDVLGDDTIWPYEPFPPGWGIDDPVWDYGAPVSALILNNNSFTLNISPAAKTGAPALLSLAPPLEYFVIENRVVTVASANEQHVKVDRPPGSRELRITGAVSRKAPISPQLLAVDDPALFAAWALYDALARRGIAIRGKPAARHRLDPEPFRPVAGAVLAERISPPLIDLLRITDKTSQNLWAEVMLREAARARKGDGSRKAGLDELGALLKELGAQPDSFQFVDGSGLSRTTLASPALIVRLLRRMYASPYRDQWRALLPIGGDDGTLENRFANQPAARAIQAKTGSLTHVNTLSGYADSATYGEVAFAIMVNNTSAPSSDVREAIDKIGMALLE